MVAIFYKNIAKIFKETREKASLTQRQVAEKANIDSNYYARIERGEVEPRGEILNNIAKALNMKLRLPLEE